MNYEEDVRRNRRELQLGPNAKCNICGETDVIALVSADLCYGCQQEQVGKRGVESHHVAGRANSTFTVPVRANDHRVLSDLQQNWPEQTLRNPDGSPLLRAAASLQGWLDLLRLVIERTVGWIPLFLEALDTWLQERLGGQWWEGFQWEG